MSNAGPKARSSLAIPTGLSTAPISSMSTSSGSSSVFLCFSLRYPRKRNKTEIDRSGNTLTDFLFLFVENARNRGFIPLFRTRAFKNVQKNFDKRIFILYNFLRQHLRAFARSFYGESWKRPGMRTKIIGRFY